MKPYSKFALITLIFFLPMLGLTACDFSLITSPTPTVTNTPTSTATPIPTFTPTPQPRIWETQEAERNLEIQNALTELELSSDTGYLGWYQTEPVEISLFGDEGYLNKFAGNVTASDFVISTDITWDTDSWPTCGLMFRIDDRWGQGDSYRFYTLRFSGLPAFSIRYFKDGSYVNKVTDETRYSDYISSDDGATNHYVLVAVGNEFQIYINGNFEGRYYDWSSRLTEGRFAFLAFQGSGQTTCTFDNTWIWIYK